MVEILFADAYYDSEREGEDYSVELRRMVSEFDGSAHIHPTDTGYGADFPAFLVQLFQDVNWRMLLIGAGAGAGSLFLLGEKIEKNLDAWARLAERFCQLLTRLKPMRIDEYGALLLALGKLKERKS